MFSTKMIIRSCFLTVCAILVLTLAPGVRNAIGRPIAGHSVGLSAAVSASVKPVFQKSPVSAKTLSEPRLLLLFGVLLIGISVVLRNPS